MRHARIALAASLAVTVLAATSASTALAAAAPIALVSVTPKTVTAPGTAVVVFRITGGDADAQASVIVRGSEVAASAYSEEVQSLTVVSAGLSGPGHLALALPPLSRYPQSCERGGIHPMSSVDAYTLTLPAHAVTALVVRVRVPAGFADQTPALQATLGARVPIDGPPAIRTASDDAVTAPVPRSRGLIDGVELGVADTTDVNTYVAKGRVDPARAGALVRIIGAPQGDGPDRPEANLLAEQTLGVFEDAMAPLGPQLVAYAKTTTNAAGRYAVRFTAPRGTVVVARTRGAGHGVTLPGASCPVQLGD